MSFDKSKNKDDESARVPSTRSVLLQGQSTTLTPSEEESKALSVRTRKFTKQEKDQILQLKAEKLMVKIT